MTAFGDSTPARVSRRELAQVIEARVEEILSLVMQEIKRSGYDGLLPAGVVLCGGTSELPGIKEVARNVIGLPVRIGKPHDLQGLVDTLTRPAFATGVGLLMWGQRQKPSVRPHPPKPSVTERMGKWFKNLLPG